MIAILESNTSAKRKMIKRYILLTIILIKMWPIAQYWQRVYFSSNTVSLSVVLLLYYYFFIRPHLSYLLVEPITVSIGIKLIVIVLMTRAIQNEMNSSTKPPIPKKARKLRKPRKPREPEITKKTKTSLLRELFLIVIILISANSLFD